MRRSREPDPEAEPPEGQGRPRRLVWRAIGVALRPLRRMWSSDDPLDDFALVHMASAAGDACVAVALAESVFFALPIGEARLRVALYLLLTVAPLAVAAPLLVPLLDRAGPRRLISFSAGAGRAVLAILLAPRVSTFGVFPLAFALMVLSKIHTITKNGLTVAYAPPDEGLVRSNARMGRVAAAGAILAAGPAVAALKLGNSRDALFLAATVYVVSALFNLRLPHPRVKPVEGVVVAKRGRMPHLNVASAGTAVLRAASGFLLFLVAFALRRGGHHEPSYWLGVLAGAATVGKYLGDFVAPKLPRMLREEGVVLGSIVGAGLAASLAFGEFRLWMLSLFAGVVGIATEFGVLAFQSLMQRSVPAQAFGRVFVRYEITFQLAWVIGAFLPAMLPVDFRPGILVMAVVYLGVGMAFLVRPFVPKRKWKRLHGGSPGPAQPGVAPGDAAEPER